MEGDAARNRASAERSLHKTSVDFSIIFGSIPGRQKNRGHDFRQGLTGGWNCLNFY
jgi:hypothetical protein